MCCALLFSLEDLYIRIESSPANFCRVATEVDDTHALGWMWDWVFLNGMIHRSLREYEESRITF